MSKRPPCPTCGSRGIAPIVYGYPGPELMEESERGEVVLGGCCIPIEPIPDWSCLKCGHEWGGVQSASSRRQAPA